MTATKLTDKQMNILVAVLAGLLVAGFSFIIYTDYEELEIINADIETKKNEIKQAEIKKEEIPDLRAKLWYMQKKHKHFKDMLPSKQESVNFYAKLDRYRLDNGIKPWKSLRTKETIIESAEFEAPANPMSMKSKTTPTQPPSTQKTSSAGQFVETTYNASLPMTFDQLLQFLNTIENDERFYGIREIRLSVSAAEANPKNKEAKESSNPEIDTELTIVSFTYTGETPLDQEVAKLIGEKYEPPESEIERFEREIKEWSSSKDFTVTRVLRNPFDKEQVLRPVIGPGLEEGNKVIKITPPPAADGLKIEMERLQKIRNDLHTLAVADIWMDLQNLLAQKDYERQLNLVQVTQTNDPDGLYKEKLQQMKQELKEWKDSIQQASRELRARQVVALGQKKIREMEDLYKEGKEKGSQEIFDKIIVIYSEIMPQFKDVEKMEEKIPEITTARKKMEEIYSNAETQIKIIQMAGKLKLQGIIYTPSIRDAKGNQDLSIVFINKQKMKKNDDVMGFVIQEIREDGIILRYKEETVPIKFKRLEDKKVLVPTKEK